MFGDDKNKIEDLKQTLYSRQSFKEDKPFHELPKKTYEVNAAWVPPVAPVVKKVKSRWSLGRILLWFSIIFFIVAVGIAGFIYYNGYNTISADNVSISITGPTTVDAGRDTSFAIAIDNKNQLDLQDAYLNVEYPDGARRDASQTEPLVLDRIPLGTVASGTHIDKTVSAVFFGLEGVQDKLKVTVEYHVLGSMNLFAKNKDCLFVLGAGPVSMVVTHVDNINSGQDVSFSVVVTSNSTAVLSNLALNVSYPFGFTFKNATPVASISNSVWQLGSLSPGDSRTITIVGKLDGQEGEDRSFKFNVGIINPTDKTKIATMFYSGSENVGIQKPFIGLDLAFDEKTVTSYSTSAGETVSVMLSYSNNMATPIKDAVITVKLDGAILDKNSVSTETGFYQSANNTITWDQKTLPALSSLNPGEHGSIQFKFKTLPFVVGGSYTRSSQKINFTTNASATEVVSGGATPVASSIARTVLVNSNIALVAKAIYNGGPIKNTGAIPPKAEKPTTYFINWSISNTFNNTSNVTVSAVLPANVKFMDVISPKNEDVTYNPVSGEVTWNAGNIKTNTGYISATRQVYFQVSLLPSLSQVGQVSTLVGDSTLKATDTFTGVALTSMANSLTTDITSDSKYKYGQGVVIK